MYKPKSIARTIFAIGNAVYFTTTISFGRGGGGPVISIGTVSNKWFEA